MSVIMIMRVPGEAESFERYAAENAAEMRGVADRAKGYGAVRHFFGSGRGEVVVIDEWPDEESFRRFFAEVKELPDIMQRAGAQGAPELSFLRKLDMPGEF
ncbi:hypothetical protein [Hamadaea tsunoensis]|uniref:hypothetical protein n=1 Tax=Hamadaea tsunoensis TaxID=53368 RepID=UPI0004132A21|nr:hypothetical protein [Hamadaea tsunoensis]